MKKAIKILVITIGIILILVIGVISYFYVAYNNFSFEDEFQVNESVLPYFNISYDESRNDFRSKSNELVLKYPETKLFEIPVSSNIDTNLTIDFCYIRGSQKTDKILILSSGIHGVEGYVGSAVQLFFIDNYINKDLLDKTSILLIHSVNPYGFKYTRRVTENNVDLNRNSDIDKELYSTINEGYPKVYNLINPTRTVEPHSLRNRFFFIKAIKAIVKESMPVLRQAVLQGQYEYPSGLYYGGNDFEPQIKNMALSIDTICDPYKTVFAIDLHTGYGERGKLHLFPNPVEESVKKRMESVFEGFHIDWGDSDDFYTYSGDFVSYIQKINNDKIFIPMLFEYGTMDSRKTLGSIKSLHTMILENQGEYYGYNANEDREKVKHDFIEMYNPSSDSWKSQIMNETKIVFDKSLKRFSELEFQ
ncbi:M14 family metallopeptidase [Bacteroidota bacterium]